MTMDLIEDAIVSAARAKGYALNSATMMMVACDLAGSTLVDGDSLVLPGNFSLKIADYLRDLHDRAPSGFSRLQQDKPDAERTVTEMRRKRPLDAAWHARHARATGITKSMMSAIAASRGENKGN